MTTYVLCTSKYLFYVHTSGNKSRSKSNHFVHENEGAILKGLTYHILQGRRQSHINVGTAQITNHLEIYITITRDIKYSY